MKNNLIAIFNFNLRLAREITQELRNGADFVRRRAFHLQNVRDYYFGNLGHYHDWDSFLYNIRKAHIENPTFYSSAIKARIHPKACQAVTFSQEQWEENELEICFEAFCFNSSLENVMKCSRQQELFRIWNVIIDQELTLRTTGEVITSDGEKHDSHNYKFCDSGYLAENFGISGKTFSEFISENPGIGRKSFG